MRFLVNKNKNMFDKLTQEFIDKPIDAWNHTLDGAGYAVQEMFAGFNSNMQVRV